MACIRIKDGFLCGPDKIVNLKPYGAKVWMEWHKYLGPTFFRSKAAIKAIVNPSKKTWAAFERWQKDNQ